VSDPERLLRGGSEFERELLDSLRSEEPPRALTRRMRQGLVVAGLLTSAKTGVASFIAIAGLVTASAGGGWLALRHRAASPAVTAPSVATTHVPARAAAPPLSPVGASAEPVRTETAPLPRPSARPAPGPSAAGDLHEEIALLDRARAAVRAGDGTGALAMLSDYQRRFGRGTFSQEATVLRVEALAKSGQMSAARKLGERFLAAHPESPHAERIERLLGGRE
jgi:TolA-binding protein